MRQLPAPTAEAIAALIRPYWPTATPGAVQEALQRGVAAPDPRQTADVFLTVPEVARRLGVSARTAWRLVQEGPLPSHYVSERSRRVRLSDLEAYLAARNGQHATTAAGTR
jgi:excisionase family DNA binding protein